MKKNERPMSLVELCLGFVALLTFIFGAVVCISSLDIADANLGNADIYGVWQDRAIASGILTAISAIYLSTLGEKTAKKD